MDKIYKLLRDNRQTGPFTLEELVQVGLKPFDLIWADGKTAGWMYPSEIDVLKPYLPSQKKEPVKEAPTVTESGAALASSIPEPVKSAPPGGETAAPSSAKHIFISMPAGATRVQAAPVQTAPVPEAITEEETPEQKLERKAMELRQRVQAQAEAKKGVGEEPELDTKYSRSLDDIKEEYAHWMHEQRHKGHKRRYSFIPSKMFWMRAALVLVVAGAGYGIFKWASAPKTSEMASATEAAAPRPAAGAAVREEKEEPVQSVINTDYSERNTDMLDQLERANKQIEEDLKRIHTQKQPTASVRKQETIKESDIPDTYEAYEEAPEGTYESKTQQPAPSSNPPVRTVSYRTEKKGVPLSQQIDVKAKYLWTQRNKGLSGLELALRNNSAQVLKTVAIDVFYYRDDRLLDKKTVYFNDVQPGQSFTLIAPGHKRASSATYQLGLISSDGGLYVAKTSSP